MGGVSALCFAMNIMKFGLVIAVCAFVILDKKNLKVLEELKINNGCDLSAYYLDEKYSISTHEFTYIEKCNAILLSQSLVKTMDFSPRLLVYDFV